VYSIQMWYLEQESGTLPILANFGVKSWHSLQPWQCAEKNADAAAISI